MNEPHISQRIKRAGFCLIALSLLVISMAIRRTQRSDWLLSVPTEIGSWTASETPLPENFVALIASPKTRGFVFVNPLDERITCQFIAPRSFEAYREPEQFTRLQISAQRRIPLFGNDKPVKAWILKMPGNNTRILVYSWLQTPRGDVSLFGDRKMEPSLLDRLSLSFKAMTQTEPQCLVRLYGFIPPADKNGIQTRRNLEKVARQIYLFNTENPSR